VVRLGLGGGVLVELAVFSCSGGHRWDAWGAWEGSGEERRFVPEDMRTYLCPTCDAYAEKARDPERLA
jgi:hypothetical protein